MDILSLRAGTKNKANRYPASVQRCVFFVAHSGLLFLLGDFIDEGEDVGERDVALDAVPRGEDVAAVLAHVK